MRFLGHTLIIIACVLGAFLNPARAQQLQNKLDLRVTKPSYLSGNYAYGQAVDFGPIFIPTIKGELVWAYDINGDSTACNTITTDLTNKIALIRRGGCSFTDKIYGAQQRGAIAVVIVNNAEDDLTVDMTSGPNGSLIKIPSVFISGNTGKKWTAALDSGKSIEIEFYPPSIEYLTFNHHSKVPLKYAPDINKVFVQLYNHTNSLQENVKVTLRLIDPKNRITTWDTLIPGIYAMTHGYGNFDKVKTPYSVTDYGWYTVEVTSSIASDTVRRRFEVTLDEYALDMDDTSEARGYWPSDDNFAAENNEGYSYVYEVGSQFRIPKQTNQDSILVSFALENPADFYGETFYLNLRNSTRTSGSEQSYNKNFDFIGIGSYTIKAEDTLYPHKLLTGKIADVNSFADITELKGMTEVIASVEYRGDGRMKTAPKFSHTPSSTFFDLVSGIIYTDKLYMDGYKGYPKPIIRMRLIDCYMDYDTTSVSACDSFRFDDSTYFNSGIYTKKYTNTEGCDSFSTIRLSISRTTYDTLYETACGSFQWGDSLYLTSGVYQNTYRNATKNACDSIVTLNLKVHPLPDTAITVENNVLTSKAQDVQFQWLDCKEQFKPIDGETFAFFAPKSNGDFALELTSKEGCLDTSFCYTINFNNSMADLRFPVLNIFPNPNDGHFQLQGLSGLKPTQFPLEVQVFQASGRKIQKQSIHDNAKDVIFMDLPNGIYFLQITHKDGIVKQKLVIERP